MAKETRKIRIDSAVSALVVIALSASCELWWKRYLLHAHDSALNVSSFYETSASVLSTLFGFVLAAAALVVALPPHHFLDKVRTTGRLEELWRTYSDCIYVLGTGTALSLAAVLVSDLDASRIYVFWTIVFAVLIGLFSSMRCVRILAYIVTIFVRDHGRNVGP